VPFFQYVMDQCDGRTLGLFTSYRNLKAVSEEVTSPHPILIQERGGGLPRGELVRRFKADTHSSLFGTDSFWTGIDVVGESLTAVVIDKIPFEHQDDPLIAAMKEANEESFWPWYTNRAIIRLRQGVGRLIRAQTDVGVIVILDERIKTKKYGLQMAKSLGPMRKSRKLEDIEAFLVMAPASAAANRAAYQASQNALVMRPKAAKPATGIRIPKGLF
jgi:ATP-dependent DNA helicase DinG